MALSTTLASVGDGPYWNLWKAQWQRVWLLTSLVICYIGFLGLLAFTVPSPESTPFELLVTLLRIPVRFGITLAIVSQIPVGRFVRWRAISEVLQGTTKPKTNSRIPATAPLVHRLPIASGRLLWIRTAFSLIIGLPVWFGLCTAHILRQGADGQLPWFLFGTVVFVSTLFAGAAFIACEGELGRSWRVLFKLFMFPTVAVFLFDLVPLTAESPFWLLDSANQRIWLFLVAMAFVAMAAATWLYAKEFAYLRSLDTNQRPTQGFRSWLPMGSDWSLVLGFLIAIHLQNFDPESLVQSFGRTFACVWITGYLLHSGWTTLRSETAKSSPKAILWLCLGVVGACWTLYSLNLLGAENGSTVFIALYIVAAGWRVMHRGTRIDQLLGTLMLCAGCGSALWFMHDYLASGVEQSTGGTTEQFFYFVELYTLSMVLTITFVVIALMLPMATRTANQFTLVEALLSRLPTPTATLSRWYPEKVARWLLGAALISGALDLFVYFLSDPAVRKTSFIWQASWIRTAILVLGSVALFAASRIESWAQRVDMRTAIGILAVLCLSVVVVLVSTPVEEGDGYPLFIMFLDEVGVVFYPLLFFVLGLPESAVGPRRRSHVQEMRFK